MNVPVFPVRLAALPLALSAAFAAPSFAQTAQTLPEVVVRATRFPESRQSLPLGVSVITAEEIRASGATTVNEAVMRVLGVPGRQDFYGAGDFSLDLRGFGSTADLNQVIVLDGQRLNEADLTSARLAVIPIEAVERIEVLRGSGAVLYGEGATGGVIVITTKAGAGVERANTASLQAGAGTHDTRDLRANATIAAGGFSFDVHGQKRKSDNHREHFRSDNEIAAVSAQWANEWLRVGARHSRDDLDAQLPGALTLAQFAADPRQSAADQRSTARLNGERNGVFLAATLGSWRLEADAAQRTRTVRSSFPSGDFDADIRADSHGLRARNESTLGSLRNILVLGYDHADWRRETLFTSSFGAFPSDATQRSRAWYLKDDVVLAGGTRLSAGLRRETARKADSSAIAGIDERQTAWELGASQPLGAAWTVYGRLGRSFRLPAVDEFSLPPASGALLPQVSRDAEIGLRRSVAGQKIEARLFHSRLRNEIGFDLGAANAFGFNGANVNFDATRRQGVELDASQAVARNLNLRLNAAWREAAFRSGPHAGKDVPLAPRRTLALRAEWLPLQGHTIAGGVQWVGAQYADLANTYRIPGYATADLRYAYRWQRVEFALAVQNLFDRKYYSSAFVRSTDNQLYVYPEPGRTFFASARVDF